MSQANLDDSVIRFVDTSKDAISNTPMRSRGHNECNKKGEGEEVRRKEVREKLDKNKKRGMMRKIKIRNK